MRWTPWLGVATVLALVPPMIRADEVPSPESVLGARPGADGRLVHWETLADYFRRVDAASDRVAVRELGPTTEGRPYLVAIVSAEGTIRDLEPHRRLQARLADPERFGEPGEADRAIASGKIAVLITCSIHSSETASTLMAMELLHDLASGDDPATREVLEKTILLLVPSANPDGVDKVADWYERSKDRPWVGGGMPELYHKYAGHDTNRDWFMLNLEETRLLTRFLYREWFPTITYDVHQMGSRGARLFVPPFHDPINPNLDPRLHQSIALIGAHMAADLASEGKKGVLTNAMYDNWWNGGNRTTPQRHNMVGVLTEAASVKLATPVFVEKGELAGATRGFPDHEPSIHFVDPWPGGWWHLRDIVDYEKTCARSLLTLAARYKDAFQRNYLALGRDAIEAGKAEPPFAWVVPGDQRDPGTAAELVRILRETGIVVRRATGPFRAGEAEFPAGSWILPASQPYRPHLKDMMERQRYPERLNPNGSAEPPYDVAGWTLPLQMGVESAPIDRPFEADSEPVDRVEPPAGGIDESGSPTHYLIRNQANDDFRVVNALWAAGVEVKALGERFSTGSKTLLESTLCLDAEDRTKAVLDEVLPRASTRVLAAEGRLRPRFRLRPQRIGVYQPWVPSMDEGWSRLVLEKFDFRYTTLHNADVRAGRLKDRIDALLIPSIGAKTIRDGYGPDQTLPEYQGGLGPEGTDALRAFVRSGGTLVCLEDSCPFAIEAFHLPVKEVVRGLNSSTFYGPGSIVRVRYPQAGVGPLTWGMPEEGSAYFDRSLAFQVNQPAAKVAASYAPADVLESGWLLGPEKIQDKAALVEAAVESGRVILFAFPPQHRGQTHGTFRLLFNALIRGGVEPLDR